MTEAHEDAQKQLSIAVPRKRCSENIQQFYRRPPMLKCDFHKFSKHLFLRTLLEGSFWMRLVSN